MVVSMKTYHVQTWKPDGSLKDSYKVDVQDAAALRHLRKFLMGHSAHVVLTPVVKARAKKK